MESPTTRIPTKVTIIIKNFYFVLIMSRVEQHGEFVLVGDEIDPDHPVLGDIGGDIFGRVA